MRVVVTTREGVFVTDRDLSLENGFECVAKERIPNLPVKDLSLREAESHRLDLCYPALHVLDSLYQYLGGIPVDSADLGILEQPRRHDAE